MDGICTFLRLSYLKPPFLGSTEWSSSVLISIYETLIGSLGWRFLKWEPWQETLQKHIILFGGLGSESDCIWKYYTNEKLGKNVPWIAIGNPTKKGVSKQDISQPWKMQSFDHLFKNRLHCAKDLTYLTIFLQIVLRSYQGRRGCTNSTCLTVRLTTRLRGSARSTIVIALRVRRRKDLA